MKKSHPIPTDKMLIVVDGKIIGCADFNVRGRGCIKYLKGSAEEHYYPYRIIAVGTDDGEIHTMVAVESDGDGSEFGELKNPPAPFDGCREIGPYPHKEVA